MPRYIPVVSTKESQSCSLARRIKKSSATASYTFVTKVLESRDKSRRDFFSIFVSERQSLLRSRFRVTALKTGALCSKIRAEWAGSNRLGDKFALDFLRTKRSFNSATVSNSPLENTRRVNGILYERPIKEDEMKFSSDENNG